MFFPEIQAPPFIFKQINNKQEQTNGTDKIYVEHVDLNRKVAGSIPDGVTGIFH
jgi:hypothetical protein